MGPDAVIGNLVNLGTGGAIIIAFVYFFREKNASDKIMMERIEKIVDRHLESEKAGRDQVNNLSEQNRALFDRVIGVCNVLASAVDATNKGVLAAVDQLRQEVKAQREKNSP